MVESIEINPIGRAIATVRLPGSKSITNRALVCAALAQGESLLCGALDSDDTRVMIECLRRLGVDIQTDPAAAEIRVAGRGGDLPSGDAQLFVGNSGTTIRFLTALATLADGEIRLDGVERMRERPIEDLLDALRQLGADVRSEADNRCPPVIARPGGFAGGTAHVAGEISSQFLSGLLMVAPYARTDVHLQVDGPLVSKPYVRMTLAVMRQFGISIEENDLSKFRTIAGSRYQGRHYAIEPDASAASYFFAAAAITGGEVTVVGLSRGSLQGDVAFCDCLSKMGCQVTWGDDRMTVVGRPLTGIDVDMNPISDTVQTLAAVALFAEGPTTIRGVGHIRHKETDRIADLATELRKLGATVDESHQGLRITPGVITPATIDTYNDHRMAMSLAVVGLAAPGVVINDPGCVAKTYPDFFTDLNKLS